MGINDVGSHALKMRGSGDDSSDLLTAKRTELEKMKEDLRQAKDDAMQSWLDSRPLIDELEKMQAELARANDRLFKANITISELQAQLGTTDMCIKSTKEEEQKFRMMVNDKNQALHKAQEEMERLKMKMDQKRRRRSKLKLVLRLKRQTLQTLKLTYEALQLEAEAFGISAAQALNYINNSETANIMVQLTKEEYDFLKGEAKEQTSLAEWRISVSEEEKLAAENSRDLAFRRLQSIYPRNISSQRNMTEQTIRNEKSKKKTGEHATRVGHQTNQRRFSKAQTNSPTRVNKGNTEQQLRNNRSYLVKKKKLSIFVRIRTFLVRKLSKYFK
ncbi:hypothetical protein Sango_1803800 [Sesamum angolense]|uniref:Uncharacterized protein n=1 Tax=Sesamum angolense TaxID=2727404 RepID=A0AAE1WH98_9LAMI|nr:hypothetical protein Sango_1803800 [Sesamum angolense]